MEAASSDLTSHAKVSFSRLLGHLCLLFHHHSRGTLSEECDTFEHATNPPAHMGTGSLPPDLDLSSLDDPSIPTEGLVDSVLRLGPSLPISCGLFRHNDLKITGPRPFDGGGFAKIWSGEKDDGKKVVIKSYRHYSSLSRLPAFLVSITAASNVEFCILRVVGRGSTRKLSFAAILIASMTGALHHFLVSIQVKSTPSPLCSKLWSTETSANI
jgi:hypothetical protein